jgi:hypothetical protein
MKGVDRKELNNATIITYALVMALLEDLGESTKKRVFERAISFLPPGPSPSEGLPVDEAMRRDAERWLRKEGKY